MTLKEGKPWTNQVEEFSTASIDVFYDSYAVTEKHMLFVPKEDERVLVDQALIYARKVGDLLVQRGECDGYNLGINIGEAAGQTLAWTHVHLIPRRNGDMEDPTGGVRHCIPDRGNYRTSEHYQDVRTKLGA